MPGILDLMNGIEAAGDRGRERGQQTALGRLYAQAATAPREQRTGLLAQIGGISPQAAFDAESHFGKVDDSARQRLGQYAAAFSALPPDQKAAAYPQLAEMGRSLGLPVPQGDYRPDYDAGISQLGQAFGGGGQAAAGVQSTYIDAQGNRVAIMRDGSTQTLGQNAPNNQIIDTGNGFYGVNRGNLQAAPVMTGGEVPFSIDPSLPPEVQANIRANEPAYAAMPDGASAQMGQQLRSAPKPQAPKTTARTLSPDEVAAAGLRPGTVAQMDSDGNVKVVQQPVSAQGQRLSATALRQVNAAKAKLIDLRAVKNQLALVQKKFAPLKDTLSAGIGGGMLPTEDGRRYDAAVSLLQQFVRKLTRTPGEGSMSDWEGKLAMLANPSRNDYEAVTQDKIDQLNSLVDQISQGYESLLQDNQSDLSPQQPAPNAGPLRYNPATGDFE